MKSVTINKSTEKKLRQLAEKKAREIRKQVSLPGWGEDESMFPKADYGDLVAILEKAYQMGFEAGLKTNPAK